MVLYTWWVDNAADIPSGGKNPSQAVGKRGLSGMPGTVAARSKALVIGTFLICFSLLAFEVSTVRTINFAIGPSFIFIAIALAMLGLTSAGSILSLFDLNAVKLRREYVLWGACLAIAALLMVTNVLVVQTKDEMNAAIRAAGKAGGINGILPLLLSYGAVSALSIGLFLSLPYFLFGALLSHLFATSRPTEYAGLYAADLIGAATGCVGIVLVMETTGYAFSVTAPAVVAVLAAAAYVAPVRRGVAALTLLGAAALALLPQLDAYRAGVEPRSDPNYLVRDYDFDSGVTESWSGWNSFTRVGAVEWTDGTTDRATLSLANGDGMAYLWPHSADRAEPLIHKPAIPALLLDPADDVLVMFAGAGADLMSLRDHGAKHVIGVEINPTIVEAGLALPKYGLADFLQADGVQLHVAEGRAFLERDRSKYDTILLSWSGATAVYYLGALAGTTQHLFTYEGLSALFDHLKDDGYAVILQVNKVNVLAALRRYMAEHGLADPERAAIVLFRDGHVRQWDGSWDDNPMLVKLGGWSEAEVAQITSRAAEHGLRTAYAPGLPVHLEYSVYQRVLSAPSVYAEIEALRQETGLRFGIVTDDRPFYLDQFENARYLSGDFWFGFPGKLNSMQDIYHYLRVMLVLCVTVVAFVLAIAPLLLRRRATPRARSARFLAYFLSLGAGFMFLEIGIIQRASILFGNPGMTIAIVLCAVILATGIGSLVSNWTFARGLTFRTVAAAVAVYAVIAGIGMPPVIEAILGSPLLAKAVVLCLAVAPGGILMGHLFPQGVALAGREDKALVPWAWAINGAMSASIAGIAPLVAQAFGFGALFYIGGALYAGILLIPLLGREPGPSGVVASPG